jgi:hypothetical protein
MPTPPQETAEPDVGEIEKSPTPSPSAEPYQEIEDEPLPEGVATEPPGETTEAPSTEAPPEEARNSDNSAVVPKTEDPSAPGLWIANIGLSMLGIVLVWVYPRRRKKQIMRE